MKTVLTILFYALILPLTAQQVIRTKVHSDKNEQKYRNHYNYTRHAKRDQL